MSKDVHTEHCCVYHGCKYSDPKCPVKRGIKAQSYPCELCGNREAFVTILPLFHRLWGKAVGTRDYEKKEWQKLQRFLEENS